MDYREAKRLGGAAWGVFKGCLHKRLDGRGIWAVGWWSKRLSEEGLEGKCSAGAAGRSDGSSPTAASHFSAKGMARLPSGIAGVSGH